jgi:VWFA-related protein
VNLFPFKEGLMRINRAQKQRYGLLVFLILTLNLLPTVAAEPVQNLYHVELDQQRAHVSTRDRQGRPSLYLTVQFKITQANGQLATDVAKDEIIVEEDGRRITELEIHQPKAVDPLSVVLALDISGSMANQGKMAAAKQSARLFLDALQGNTDCGLILFDHELRVTEPLAGGRNRWLQQRGQLRDRIEAAQPRGGTAYLDATAHAVRMLSGVPGRKAVLLLTDGVDLNSKLTLADVIIMAGKARVPVYTLGIGEPGRRQPVTTVLVLDHSSSMSARADTTSDIPKIKALHQAAGRFVDLMPADARTTLLPFSTRVETPEPFSADKTLLKRAINRLKPDGETALFDAAYAAIETLEAARPPGKRAVIVLTDGIDNSSRRRVDEIVDRAREARIPLHMLGLGQPGELDEKVMRSMAEQTGGGFHHAQNEERLYQIFEELSIQLHDDGIDRDALTQLAETTGGKFFHVRDVSKLHLYYQELSAELQNTYTVTFPSQRQTHDGTARGIDISVVRNGVRASPVASLAYTVHGVVVPRMDPNVFLVLLALLSGMLFIPVGIRRLVRYYGG